MPEFKCNSCGSVDSRKCNGDNSICIVCGTPDDFDEIPTNWELLDELEEIFDMLIESDVKCDGFQHTGKDITNKLKSRL